jgi:hypothetical protein
MVWAAAAEDVRIRAANRTAFIVGFLESWPYRDDYAAAASEFRPAFPVGWYFGIIEPE